ncbi:MAG TPA: RbsD/FucU domain-containing protein [Acidiphilium sp.]|nr:RbsD/FucU domain-containing protein [Acidiphilium sp.]
MLIGIDPLLTADLLHALRAMGHGDSIAVVDANFPAATCARRLIVLPGTTSGQMLQAILGVLPIDDFVAEPLRTMQVVGDPAAVPPAVAEFRRIAAAAGIGAARIGGRDRHEFYADSRDGFAIVQTGDRRRYANILITKGVIAAGD